MLRSPISPRSPRIMAWCWCAPLAGLCFICPANAADQKPSACLFPENTLAYASLLDVADARERFSKTAIGGLLKDAALQPLVNDVLRRIEEGTADLRERVGLTTHDLFQLPQGELAVAVVPREKGEPSPVVLIDTGKNIDDAKRLVQAIVEGLEEAGNKPSQQEVGDTVVTVFESAGRRQQDVAFFKRDNTLVWSNDVAVLEQILELWGEEGLPSLATRSDFSTIMQRSRRYNPKPQLTWYVNPLAIFEESAKDRLEMQMALMMIPALGLDGIKAVGGAVELDAGPYDSLWHAHLVLDKPRKGIVDLVRPKTGQTTPPDWVPADAADYLTVHWDLPGTIDSLRTLYDSFRGDGALDEFVATRMSGPLGVDLLIEVLPELTGRITFMRWIDKPVERNSEGNLLAFEWKPGSDADELLRHVVQKYVSRFMRREFAGVVYYELVRGGPPNDVPGPRRRPATPVVGIIDDTLVIADRESLFKAVAMTQAGGFKRLAEADDFEMMSSATSSLTGDADPVMLRFQRPAERTLAWYEPIRADRQEERANRPRRRRGPLWALESTMQNHSLPPFEALRKYFPPGGAVLVDDDAGLHYTAFTLKTAP